MTRMKNLKVIQMVKMTIKKNKKVKNEIESQKTPFRTSPGWATYLTKSRDKLQVPLKQP